MRPRSSGHILKKCQCDEPLSCRHSWTIVASLGTQRCGRCVKCRVNHFDNRRKCRKCGGPLVRSEARHQVWRSGFATIGDAELALQHILGERSPEAFTVVRAKAAAFDRVIRQYQEVAP